MLCTGKERFCPFPGDHGRVADHRSLRDQGTRDLSKLGYKNVHIKIGDGHQGWAQKAPFDAIIVTCAPEQIPRPLVEQLKEGGRMIIPVGRVGTVQKLVRGVKTGGRIKTEEVMLVRFVPMVKGDD